MNDDQEVDWGNDEDDYMLSRTYFGSVGMSNAIGGGATDDVEDAVSLGGDEEEEFAAYGARPNEPNMPSADKVQTFFSKRDAKRRSASVGVSPRKQTTPLPPSPQPEVRQPTPKLTHALPPKPVVSSSIRAPPSTTAASPMSFPRKERRSNGSTSKKGDEPPLSDKETKSSRTSGRDGRQRDSRTDESSWAHPGSSATDPQSHPRDTTRSSDDRDGRPPPRREDDCYRPSQRQAHGSSDEEGREPDSHRPQSRHDTRYRYDDRDRHHDYPSGDHTDRPVPRPARLSPADESLDRSRTGFRESNGSRAYDRDRDVSPLRDDSSRRVLRRDDYSPYDSYDKGPRDCDDLSRRSAGTVARSRYPESFNGRPNSVILRDPHTQNQGPGRSSTLRRNSPSPRPRSRSPPYNRRDDRRHSPPRYQEYPADSFRLTHYRGRAESPPRHRGPDKLDRRDTPPDLPQRRSRGISDAHDPDYASKRRKMDDSDSNPPTRRGPVGSATYIPLEASTSSTSPRSAGALDDLSRQRRREPLPPQSHRFKEASELSSRPPLSGSNRVVPQSQPSAQLPHRYYPLSSKDHEVFPSRPAEADMSRHDRSRGSGRDSEHVYVEKKFSRDDHMKVDPPYPPRDIYEEPARQDLANRTSLLNDAMDRHIPPNPRRGRRESISAVPASPIRSAPLIVENDRGRSHDRSPRPHHEPRQMSPKASLPVMQSAPPQDMQLIEDHRHREHRIDRDREGHPSALPLPLPRNSSSPVVPRSRSTGRYDIPEGGQRSLRSPEPHSAPPAQEQSRHHASTSNPRRERQALPVAESNEAPPRVGGDTLPVHSPAQERANRSDPPANTDLPPPSLSQLSPSREWIPRQPEFLLNLPPPSTRLPGAPPPPILPPSLYGAPRDPVISHLPPHQDENTSVKPESEPGLQPAQEIYKHEPPSPDKPTKDIPPPRSCQTQEGRHEQAPLQSSDRTPRALSSDGLKENSGEERRSKVPSETRPASWDRPRDNAPPPTPTRKPLTLPASLPAKPVAALGDLNLQQSSSLRAGHHRSRRSQQQSPDESNSHSTRWVPAPRGDEGRDKERERNRWEPAPEYRGPSLLARMSSSELPLVETRERETERKRARTRKYHGV